MRDIAIIRRGEMTDKTGKVIPVARVCRIQANKYSPRYMALAQKVKA